MRGRIARSSSVGTTRRTVIPVSQMQPDTVHYGRSAALTAQRGITLNAAFAAHPARFKGIAPQPPTVPLAVWINPPKKETTPQTITPHCSLNS